MALEYKILVMNDTEDSVSFEHQTIRENHIPDVINGESGHHIYYVCILTEWIARNLAKISERYSFSDEEIEKMVIAVSLHDIGKSRVPKAILDKTGSLAPVEYDIVKRHTVFGEQILREASTSLDADILEYACQVARHHHERFDGTGYPDGLVGDDIPIIAQIASIADAYEALTSDRSYKKALSEDVALEMISNGMCGVFNPLLIDCLASVVSDRVFTDIRDSLMSSKTVFSDSYSLPPQKVLLMGNLRYVTQQFLDSAFPNAHVSIVGKCNLSRSSNLKIYDADKPLYKAIFDTYDYDLILYFANELTYDTIDSDDMEELRKILKASKYLSATAKFLYLSSLDAAFEGTNDRGIIAASKENLCLYWAKENHIDLKIIRIPYLYNGASENDYLHDLFVQIHQEHRICMRESEDSKTYFLSSSDLAELIIRIADTWTSGAGILSINDDFDITFGELCEGLATLEEDVQVEWNGKNPPKQLKLKNTAVKKQYSWFSKISILADLQDQYDAYLKTLAPQGTRWSRLKERLRKYGNVVKVIELFLMFFLCEFLVQITDSALFFSVVDFRMAYIVIMATMYGLPYGMGAAFLSSLSWIVAKIMSGTNWMTLFYEPTNWLAFIFFFFVGAVCGYVKLKKDEQMKFIKEENHLLEEKLVFTRRIYEDTFNEKRDLKKQIVGSKDSFGKIFDITRQLNTVDARELYLKIVNCFEGILENKTISVYSVNPDGVFARLEVASRDIMSNVSRSISLETYAPVMEVVQKGEVWRNNHLLPNMPMFACGIYEDEKPLLIIFLWNSQMDQRSLYYVNLFHILCDLTQMSLIRAHHYSMAMYDKQYIPETRIQNEEAYKKNLKSFTELSERKVFQFQQLEVVSAYTDIKEMDAQLSTCVRTNDMIGMMEDGTIRILLSQAGEDDLQFILPRFEKMGIEVKVLN